jgi:hypothetical protein
MVTDKRFTYYFFTPSLMETPETQDGEITLDSKLLSMQAGELKKDEAEQRENIGGATVDNINKFLAPYGV